MNMKTLVLSGSVRSTQNNLDRLDCLAQDASSREALCRSIEKDLDSGATYCNSDILTAVALLAMYREGAHPKVFSLASLFRRFDTTVADESCLDNMNILADKQEELCGNVIESDGLLLVTPVYFGDRSSVANKLLQIASRSSLFNNKIFGCASVGAKRNGGQETTVIYCLLEALKHGALIIGNGPPTAQYGGTAVGGHRGTVVRDDWGIATTYGVASRVVQLARIYQSGLDVSGGTRLRVLILVTSDNSARSLLNLLQEYTKALNLQDRNVEFVVFDTLKHKIYRCIGCKSCPPDGAKSNADTLSLANHAQCTIKNDSDGIQAVHEELIQADAVLVAGINIKDAGDITYRYQVLVERTRYIRRDNFEMTNKLFGSFTLHEVGAQSNSLHFVKTVTSYIRHNVALAKPIDVYMHDDRIIVHDEQNFKEFITKAKSLKFGRTCLHFQAPEYVTAGIGGYDPDEQ